MEEKTLKKPYLVLGIDAGISSVGWCVLDMANEHVVALNSRLFDAPELPKNRKSTASVRGEARRARRLTKRRKTARARCLRLIEEYELEKFPHDAGGALKVEEAGKQLQRKKGEPDPVLLRAEALERPLSGRELARILYWFSAHRGYIPHGESSSDEGKVLSAIKENAGILEERNYETVGQYQAKLLTTGKGFRNKADNYSRCISNAQYVAEIDTIFDKQNSLNNSLAKPELKNRFLNEIFTYLTDTTAQEARIYASVSPCVYFEKEEKEKEKEKAAAKCCPSFEMARAWERLLNIRVRDERGNERPLSRETIEKAMNMLFSTESAEKTIKKLSWKVLRKFEGENISGRDSFKGISEEDEKKAVCEPTAWNAFRKALPTELLARMHADRELGDAIASLLAYSSRNDSLSKILSGEAKTKLPTFITQKLAELTDEEKAAIKTLDCTNKIYSGYGTRSARALRMIVEEFEQGAKTLSDAEKVTGLDKKRNEKPEPQPFLGLYEEFDPTCKNPVVLRAMAQVRKIINAVIKKYGRPAEIHVELAQKLKLSKKLQSEIDAKNKKRKNERDKKREEIARWMNREPDSVSNKTLLKYELLEEQGWRDIYTNKEIHKEDFFTNAHMVEVDHILPHFRSGIDSRANKVCVLARSNQNKKQRTPYEWMTSGEASAPSWEDFCARVMASNLPANKKEKLTNIDFAEKESGFIERNLNDTRYMTRKMAQWLDNKLLFAELPNGRKKHVVAPSGGATSLLRYCWGFDKKDREANELHHAVDAAIIAACNQGIIQKVARIHSEKRYTPEEEYRKKLASAEPWPGFAKEVQEKTSLAIPSRMADRSQTGRLFEDTFYRLDGYNKNGLAILSTGTSASHKSKPSGNYIQLPTGAYVKPDGIAFLQLWWDPKAKKNKGEWLVDPVYLSDIKSLTEGTHLAKSCKAHAPRSSWNLIPDHVKANHPLRLCYGDFILVKGEPRIYVGFDIANCKWKLTYPWKSLQDETAQTEASKISTIKKLGINDISVLDVGPLGFPEGLKANR